MDELRMIGALLDESPSERSATTVREQLEQEIHSPRRSRRFSPPRWNIAAPMLAAGAVAAVTAVAVVLSSGTTPRAPDSGRAEPMAARTVLLSAAANAERTPPTRGKYWHVVTRERMRVTSGSRLYDVVQELGLWDAGPGEVAWVAQRTVSKKDLGPAPKDGPTVTGPNRTGGSSPGPVGGGPAPGPTNVPPSGPTNVPPSGPANVPPSGSTTGPGAGPTTGRDGSATTGATGWTKVKVAGGEAFRLAIWENATPPDVRKLPDEPEKLRTFLDATLRRTQATVGPIDPVEWLFSNAQRIGSAPVSPKVLGAMYRLLATDPALRVVGTVTDPLGRKGTAIARRVTAPGHAWEDQLVIDPATGRLLVQRTVPIKGSGPGDVVPSSMLLSYGWTGEVPDHPLGKVG